MPGCAATTPEPCRRCNTRRGCRHLPSNRGSCARCTGTNAAIRSHEDSRTMRIKSRRAGECFGVGEGARQVLGKQQRQEGPDGRGRRSHGAPAARVTRRLGRGHAGGVVAVSPVLVGRAAEIAVLGESWTLARGGSPATVLIGGEAGIGKTRLVGHFTV